MKKDVYFNKMLRYGVFNAIEQRRNTNRRTIMNYDIPEYFQALFEEIDEIADQLINELYTEQE